MPQKAANAPATAGFAGENRSVPSGPIRKPLTPAWMFAAALHAAFEVVWPVDADVIDLMNEPPCEPCVQNQPSVPIPRPPYTVPAKLENAGVCTNAVVYWVRFVVF